MVAEEDNITNLSLRLVASTVTSFLVLALLLFMVHRLRQRRLMLAMRREYFFLSSSDLKQNEAWGACVEFLMQFIYLWWSLCTFYLVACQVRVTVGSSGLCCCIPCYSCDVSQEL